MLTSPSVNKKKRVSVTPAKFDLDKASPKTPLLNLDIEAQRRIDLRDDALGAAAAAAALEVTKTIPTPLSLSPYSLTRDARNTMWYRCRGHDLPRGEETWRTALLRRARWLVSFAAMSVALTLGTLGMMPAGSNDALYTLLLVPYLLNAWLSLDLGMVRTIFARRGVEVLARWAFRTLIFVVFSHLLSFDARTTHLAVVWSFALTSELVDALPLPYLSLYFVPARTLGVIWCVFFAATLATGSVVITQEASTLLHVAVSPSTRDLDLVLFVAFALVCEAAVGVCEIVSLLLARRRFAQSPFQNHFIHLSLPMRRLEEPAVSNQDPTRHLGAPAAPPSSPRLVTVSR